MDSKEIFREANNMGKYSTVVLVAALLLAAITFAQQSPKATTQNQGRFSLIQAETRGLIPPGDREPGLFVIDTQTGRVWKYAPMTVRTDEKGEKLGSRVQFFPVVFEENAYLTEGLTDRPK